MMNELPVLGNMHLCERLIIESGTQNVSLINCFSSKPISRTPSFPFSFVVYAVLTDGFGPFTMKLEIIRLDTGNVIYQKDQPMLKSDRLTRTPIIWRVNELVLPVVGRYELNLFIDREHLGMATFVVREQGT